MKFLDEIREKVNDAVADAKCEGYDSACVTYDCNDGYIDVFTNSKDYVEVTVCPDSDLDRRHTNIEQAITDALPLWDDVEVEEYDEWNEHGFRDAADYWHYRLG